LWIISHLLFIHRDLVIHAPVTIMIAITVNDRLGKKVRVLCNEDDTIGDIKKVIAIKTGTKAERIILKKWYTIS